MVFPQYLNLEKERFVDWRTCLQDTNIFISFRTERPGQFVLNMMRLLINVLLE